MIIVMQLEASERQVQLVCDTIREQGFEPLVLPGENRVAIGIPASLSPDQREGLEALIGSLGGVSKITQTSRPYKLASLEFNRVKTTVKVKDAVFGPGHFTTIAGPCSIESMDQFRTCAEVVKSAGVKVIRGGAFKPRTSPYSFQGLAEEGLKIMRTVADDMGLVTITEVMSGETVPMVAGYADILQIGARSMQNFPLLIEAGKSGKPILLKRGPSATIDEFLLAAEYLLNQGNSQIILCERGVIPLDRSYTRNTLDLSAVAVLKEYSHLPVVVDPSHGTGVAKYVPSMSKAAMAAGADGIMIEMHPDPGHSLSDASQALTPQQFCQLMDDLKRLSGFVCVRM